MHFQSFGMIDTMNVFINVSYLQTKKCCCILYVSLMSSSPAHQPYDCFLIAFQYKQPPAPRKFLSLTQC